MNAVIEFMNGGWGRSLRGLLGIALIGYGLLGLGGAVGIVVAVVGLVPLALGAWGHCLLELLPHGTSSAGGMTRVN